MWHDPWQTKLHVLLVEDDDLVRACLVELLADAGWRITEAADSEQALEQTEAGTPDVLVTDLGLGRGMDGLALIAAARRRWPSVRAVLISGDTEEHDLGPDDRFLLKPFRADMLVRLVTELTAQRSVAGRLADRLVQAGGRLC